MCIRDSNTRAQLVLRHIDDIDVHPLGGISFLFAGLLYRVENDVLRCENGPSLFPDVFELDNNYLGTFISDNVVGTNIKTPLKVLYVPTSQTPESGEITTYTQKKVVDSLTNDIINAVGQKGFTQVVGIEKLLNDNEIRGFSYDAFQQIFSSVHQVTKHLKQVVGYYQNPGTGAATMYPDIKFLPSDTDINGAGEVYPLYPATEENIAEPQTRAAAVMSSVPRLNFTGKAFFTEATGTTEFRNGSGYAAGGVGVTVALYKNLGVTRDATTGAITQSNAGTQIPTGVLYFYVDYSSPEAVKFFDTIDMVAGYSTSGRKYHSATLRRAAATLTVPSTIFESQLAAGISTTDVNGADAKVLSSATDVKPTTERRLVYPFAPSLSTTSGFGLPCYYASETPGEGSTVHSWVLDNALVDSITETGDTRNFNINQEMARYLVLPTTYRSNSGRLHVLQGRSVITDGNIAYFSQVGELSKFSNPLARFWDSFTTASRSYNILRDSGITGAVGRTPIDPEKRQFTDSLGRTSDIVAVLGESPERTFIGTKNSIHRVLPSSFLGGETGLQVNKIAPYGVSSNFVADSSYTVAALDNKVLALRYYEEASGYVTDVINEETKIRDVDTAVSLIGKHRIILFHKENTNVVYCMAIGANRQFKGFSVFTFPRTISKLKGISPDKVGCLLQGGSYAELDFRADEDTVYQDDIDNKQTPFESRMATLPIIIVDQQIASPDYTVVPRSVTMGVHGYIDFTLSLVDDANDNVTETQLRYPNADQVDETRLFSGLFTYKGIGHTNSDSPRIRISKKDDKYIAISSMILTVGEE